MSTTPAARAYAQRQARRQPPDVAVAVDVDADVEVDAEPDLRADYARLQFAGLLRRELRACVGDPKDKSTPAELAKLIAGDGPRAARAAEQLDGRRAHVGQVLDLAERHDLTGWLRWSEIEPADRAALIGDADA